MRSYCLLLVMSFAFSSCLPLPTEQGICKTSQGDVNTHNIIGVWKKDPSTAKESKNYSEGIFKLLYIAQGSNSGSVRGDDIDDGVEVDYNSSICEKHVSNKVETRVTKAGLYFHDDGRKRIKTNMIYLDEEEPDPEPREEIFTYRFTGSCNGTKLHLTKSGKTETYTFFATSPPTNSCDLGSE